MKPWGKISIFRKLREQGFCVVCSSDGLRLGLGVGGAGAGRLGFGLEWAG